MTYLPHPFFPQASIQRVEDAQNDEFKFRGLISQQQQSFQKIDCSGWSTFLYACVTLPLVKSMFVVFACPLLWKE